MLFRKTIFVLVSLGGAVSAAAQHFGMTYTTELQTGFHREVNWVNLLRMEVQCPLGGGFTAGAATISVARTLNGRVAGDALVFSNIEEENLPLAPAVLGVEWSRAGVTVFAGVRNLGEDYFVSPCTSLFTNSSCGLFPTLSAVYRLANYPLASLCADVKYTSGKWQAEASLYNGRGYSSFAGRENVFRFCPATDGAMGVASVNYQDNGSCYDLGFALCGGMRGTDEGGAEEFEKEEKKGLDCVLWGNVEQRVCKGTSLMLQYSFNTWAGAECRHYAGAGLVTALKGAECGVFGGYARFLHGYEFAAEFTCKVPCLGRCYVQPALHLISGSNGRYAAGLLRFGCEI